MSSALLLIGSPKAGASASRAIGEALMSRLADRGWDVATQRVPLRDPDGAGTAALFARADAADLVVLAAPVYIDTLPAPVTRVLERWQDAVAEGGLGGRPRFAVLTQCGFPEAEHTAPFVTAARLFASSIDLPWAGDIAFGMGGALEGQGIERGPFARFGPRLDEAADALTEGRPIPADVSAAFASGAMPKAFYLTVAQLAWRWQARRNHADAPIRERRYAR